ncbi:hypothetical protein [Campylobacter canadensis]|uniref:DUF3899 domain-containing protein n=1 Tax=Campylobacter canadensis TaxID=449520 RepID=A0ABS7WV74_9BACT|nr:hypothetical protein [Campylobacter canadensis]MBZ7987934.1 hypothetical protein [Campylobacter canadensis]MBZ7998539.1 hypothetical protein [Campylobacter canadensis]
MVLVFFSEKKEVLLELVMIFFILGVIFVSIMKIMFAAEYFFKANYALNTLQKLSDEMLQESPNFGELEEFKNYKSVIHLLNLGVILFTFFIILRVAAL